MELFDNLNEIKSQLFDAPADVKSAFNGVIKYFSDFVRFKGKENDIAKVTDGVIIYNRSGAIADGVMIILVKKGKIVDHKRFDYGYGISWIVSQEVLESQKLLNEVIKSFSRNYEIPAYDLRNAKYSVNSESWIIGKHKKFYNLDNLRTIKDSDLIKVLK